MQATRYEAENFGAEAKLQNKLLDNLNDDIDRVNENMIKIDNKMKELIKATSQCSLWIILIIEFVILLILFFLGFWKSIKFIPFRLKSNYFPSILVSFWYKWSKFESNCRED